MGSVFVLLVGMFWWGEGGGGVGGGGCMTARKRCNSSTILHCCLKDRSLRRKREHKRGFRVGEF